MSYEHQYVSDEALFDLIDKADEQRKPVCWIIAQVIDDNPYAKGDDVMVNRINTAVRQRVKKIIANVEEQDGVVIDLPSGEIGGKKKDTSSLASKIRARRQAKERQDALDKAKEES